MPGQRKPLATLVRLAIVLAPVLVGVLSWASYRFYAAAAGKSMTSVRSSLGAHDHLNTAGDQGWGEAQSAVMFSAAPLTSLAMLATPIDPDPVASFRQLIALPAEKRAAPNIDPRALRTLLDRGVATYATAANDKDRARGATLIQGAALVGLPPARHLLVRNFPQSEPIRSVVPANDVIRYGLATLMDPAASEDSKNNFLALGQYFALHGQLDLFVNQILISLRGDSHPQLDHRLDILLEVLAGVSGSCAALARLIPQASEPSGPECSVSFSEKLRKYIETTTPTNEEEESKRRGLLMLSQVGGR